jgi:hypothetical protein
MGEKGAPHGLPEVAGLGTTGSLGGDMVETLQAWETRRTSRRR